VIRHVRAGEAARVKALRLRALADAPDAFGATYEGDAARPEAWWEMIATLSDAGIEQRTFVFEEAGEWLGFILIRRDDDHPPDAVINATWVAPQARGRGIATALTRECVGWARERGFPAVGVAVTAGNAAAQRTYEAAGFAPAFTAEWTEGGRTLNLVVLKQTL
jgi:ribosomal protein S18 acetylase RimI-like enzyme